MANIAVLFIGQQRWYDLTNLSWKHNFLPALQNDSVHYFCHLWETEGDFDKTLNKNGLEQFKKIYSPLTIEIEPDKSRSELHEFFNCKRKIHETLLSQSYSFYKCFQLLNQYQKENKITFDIFIKLRTDLVFLNAIDLKLDQHSIYTKNLNGWRPSSNYIHDFMFLTKNYQALEKMSNMGFYFDFILKESKNFLYSNEHYNSVCPEEILGRFIAHSNIENKYYNFNVDLARNINHSFTIEDIGLSN